MIDLLIEVLRYAIAIGLPVAGVAYIYKHRDSIPESDMFPWED